MKNKIFWLFLILFSTLPIFWIHQGAFQSHLRHGMVEDGNISLFAGDVLDERSLIEKYTTLTEQIGKINGLYRPASFLYQSIPFFLTLVKNGDYRLGMPGHEIRQKINGDLRVYMVFYLVTFAGALFFGGVIVYYTSGSRFYSLLFPLSVIFSFTLMRNITQNDAAEVPQILGMAFYFSILFSGERIAERKPGYMPFFYILALLSAIFAYHVKETTVAVMPAVAIYCILRYGKNIISISSVRMNRSHAYAVYNLLVNIILVVWVSGNIYNYWGAYSNDNYAAGSLQRTWNTLVMYTKGLAMFPPTVYFPLAAFFITLLLYILKKRSPEGSKNTVGQALPAGASLFLLAFGFLLLNLPWGFVLPRYVLPVAYFSALSGAIFLGSINSWLFENRIFIISGIIPVIIFGCSYPAAKKEMTRVDLHYESVYGANKYVDVLTEEMMSEAHRKNGKLKVQLDLTRQSNWMWLQVARIVNQENGMNVKLPSGTRFAERTYFKSYDNGSEISIWPSDGGGYFDGQYDIVYAALPKEPQEYQRKKVHLKKVEERYKVLKKICWKGKGKSPGYDLLKLIPINGTGKSFNSSSAINLVIDKSEDFSRLKPLYDIEVRSDPSGILLDSSGIDPHIMLPPFEKQSRRGPLMIKVNMWSPVDTEMKIYYKTGGKPYFNECQSIVEDLNMGDNVRYLLLPTESILDSIRFDPGKKPGIYKLYSLEARTIETIKNDYGS